MTAVLFLDIDGVLNRHGLGRRVPQHRVSPAIDHRAAALVDRIVEATGAVIVLTSSWRYRIGRALLGDLLRRAGLVTPIADVTPHLPGRRRGIEIQTWLNDRGTPCRAAILDDGPPSDFGWLASLLVRTRGSVGLTEHEAHLCCTLIGTHNQVLRAH